MAIFIIGLIVGLTIGAFAGLSVGSRDLKLARIKAQAQSNKNPYEMKEHLLTQFCNPNWGGDLLKKHLRDLAASMKTLSPESLVRIDLTYSHKSHGNNNWDWKTTSKMCMLKTLLDDSSLKNVNRISSVSVYLIEVIEPSVDNGKFSDEELNIIEELRNNEDPARRLRAVKSQKQL